MILICLTCDWVGTPDSETELDFQCPECLGVALPYTKLPKRSPDESTEMLDAQD